MYTRVHTCKARTYKSCANEFAKKERYDIVTTLDDGNCFFDTLSKAGIAYKIDSLSYNHKELRAKLVEHTLINILDYEPYFGMKLGNNNGNYNNNVNYNNNGNYNNGNNNNNYKENNEQQDIESRVISLGKDGMWNNADGDLISQIAANAFIVNINIYDVKKSKSKYVINLIKIHPHNVAPLINILRINDGHYELLVEKSNALNSTRKNRSLSPKKSPKAATSAAAAVNNLSNRFGNMSVSNLNSKITIKQGAYSYTMKMRHAGLVELKVPDLKRHIEVELGQPIPKGIKTKQELLSHLNSQR